MPLPFANRAYAGTLTRRDFIKLSALAALATAAGCATNPVTGQSQFMLMGEGEEQKQTVGEFHDCGGAQTGHQRYGDLQDAAVNGAVGHAEGHAQNGRRWQGRVFRM